MLADSAVEEIERLLDVGELTPTQIARQVGTTPPTVRAILNGERGTFSPPGPYVPPVQSHQRCDTCGAMIYRQPCLYCQSLASRQEELPAALRHTCGAERQPDEPTPAAIAEQCAEFRRRRPRLPVGACDSVFGVLVDRPQPEDPFEERSLRGRERDQN